MNSGKKKVSPGTASSAKVGDKQKNTTKQDKKVTGQSVSSLRRNRSSQSSTSRHDLISEVDPDLLSRSRYYSDFFAVHEHIATRFSYPSFSNRSDFDDNDIPFPRVVEGSEDVSELSTSSSDSDTLTPSYSAKEQKKYPSPSKRKRRPLSFVPSASSTMINEIGESSAESELSNHFTKMSIDYAESAEHSTSFQPQLCSTFLDDLTVVTSLSESLDQHPMDSMQKGCSVYTWSIYDKTYESSLGDFNVGGLNGQKLVVNPPSNRKRCHTSKSNIKPKLSDKCVSSAIEKNGMSKTKPKLSDKSKMTDSVTPHMRYQDSVCVIKSLYSDEDICLSTKHLPRTNATINVNADVHRAAEQPNSMYRKSSSSSNIGDNSSSVVIDRHSLMKKLRKFNKTLLSHDRSSLQTLTSL